MTVKLVKKQRENANREKPAETPSFGQLLANTQNWVEEFKTRKARNAAAMIGVLRRSKA